MCKEVEVEAAVAVPCKNCGILLVGAGGARREYCSAACRQAWHRRKVRVCCPHCKEVLTLVLPASRKAS